MESARSAGGAGNMVCAVLALNVVYKRPIGALATSYTAAQGWDRVTNATAGTPGLLAENRTAFEARRRLSVAINSVNGVQPVYGAVLNVPNVLDAFGIDNPTSEVTEYGATHYPLAAHSLFVSALGR